MNVLVARQNQRGVGWRFFRYRFDLIGSLGVAT
jgi:hypothetical protein